ncbi:MAG: hypothetical protein M0R03_02300 [Novosphingobium sp.]|nr:hypothetical protein [Novosphingobium sp.]
MLNIEHRGWNAGDDRVIVRPCFSGLAGLAASTAENEKAVSAGLPANPAKVAKFRTCEPLAVVPRESAIVSGRGKVHG